MISSTPPMENHQSLSVKGVPRELQWTADGTFRSLNPFQTRPAPSRAVTPAAIPSPTLGSAFFVGTGQRSRGRNRSRRPRR
jgi:hypothetical protein